MTLARAEPAHVAESEAAVQPESEIADGVVLWLADREGQPLFLSVDLGEWVVWLNVGYQDNRPTTETLLELADQLRGKVTDNGVVLPDLVLPQFRMHMSAGDENVVTVVVGDCFRDSIPGATVVEDLRYGQVIRTDGYASWCLADDLEVTVHGSADFVEEMVSELTMVRHTS